MTPKPCFYGHAPSYSPMRDLAQQEFQPLLGDGCEINASALGQRRHGAERLEGLDRIVERPRVGDYLVPVAVVSV